MREFGVEVGPVAIAAHYDGILDALLVDERDRGTKLAPAHAFADTLMTSLADRTRVARTALDLAAACG
jgi:LPPG:FO 2-phospho-L-lactate transferase